MSSKYHIGIDLGGTKIDGVLLSEHFEKNKNPEDFIIERQIVPTEASRGYDHILRTTAGIINRLMETAGEKDSSLTTVGIGLPGHVSRKNGTVKNSNTTCLIGKPLWSHLAGAVGRKITFENDANCLALSEAVWGAGRGHGIVFGVILGTGVGGGLVINGRIHSGVQGIAGEWGHNVLHENGNECYCGKRGCVETYLSGPWFEARLQKRTLLDPGERATDFFSREREKRSDSAFLEMFNEYMNDFGLALSGVVNIVDPDAIVIGGGLSNIEQLYTAGVKALEKQVFNDELLTPVLKSRFGPSSGVFGAALNGLHNQI